MGSKPEPSLRRTAARLSAPVRAAQRRMALSLLAVAALLALGFVAVLRTGTTWWWLAPAVVIAVLPGWAAWAFVRARPANMQWIRLGTDGQPLQRMCDELALRLSVPAISRVGLWGDPRPRLVTDSAGVLLLIGGPGLWHLRDAELRALLAPAIAASAVAGERSMRRSDRIGRRILLSQETVPTPVRWLTAGMTARVRSSLDRMEADLAEWGQLRAEDRGVEQDAETGLLEEAWALLLERFALPSYVRGQAPTQLGSGLHDFISALEAYHVIDRRKSGRAPGARFVDRLTESAALDRRVSLLIAEHHGVEGTTLEWAQYPEAVVEPHQRELAARLVSAVGLVRGDSVEPTMADILEVLETKAPAVAAALHGHTPKAVSEEGAASALLGEHLIAFVTTTVVDAQRATREHDWLAGHLVLTREREVMDVEEVVAGFVREPSAKLRVWMEWLGLMQTPVRTGAAEDGAPDIYVTGVCGPVLHRGVAADLVRHGADLLVLADPAGFSLRRRRQVLSGSRWVAEMIRRTRATPVEELLRQVPAAVRMPLKEVAKVRLRRVRRSRSWKVVFELPKHRVVLRGNIDARTVAQALRAELGERVTIGRLSPKRAGGRHAHKPVTQAS